MEVRLAYGSDGLGVELPEAATTVIEPRFGQPLNHPAAALRAALRRPIGCAPLRTLSSPGQRVAISVCDITRAQPREPMLRAILAELEGCVPVEDVVVLIATGTHRANTPAELREMLGPELASGLRVVNHDARDPQSLVDLGRVGAGVSAQLNREWVEADLRITAGFVEPHFFAGFSGGPKMVAPGLAGLETVLTLHDARRIGHPRASWGVIDGNPVQQDIRAITRKAPPHFSCDVLLDRDQAITHVFAGELEAMHAAACRVARDTAMCPVPKRFDVVITTNSGYPLDQNLYQAVKGMSAAASVCAEGGTIICAAECRDGLPDHGSFASLLSARETPSELLEMIEAPGFRAPDQWQVQIQSRIQSRHRVQLKAGGLRDEQLAAAHLEAIDDVAGAARQALTEAGAGASLCVLPEGPQTIPYLAPRMAW